MSSALLRIPHEPTVIHRTTAKMRPSLPQAFQHVERAYEDNNANTSSNPTPSMTESSKNSLSGKSPEDSTGLTSLDSKFEKSYTGSLAHEKTHAGASHFTNLHNATSSRRHPDKRSSPNSNLTTIQETVIDQAPPSVVTAERAAAAKIFLETYFNERLTSGPNPRSIRLRQLQAQLFSRPGGIEAIRPAELEAIRAAFCRCESDHLRETRVMKVRSIRALSAPRGSSASCLVNDYEVLKVLGRGSFGVVRLVREKRRVDGFEKPGDGWSEGERRQVYAMKVIRKSTMLRTSQEGHLRAERDFLVQSEGSRWIVPLIASFQDAANLYLVMEYMPGGDFLGLLIRENTLHEAVARFYIAEMILCVEAAHALRCIHRDIKPDNFLISASGHLKISDFGLAFNGHWSHDTSYYNSHRYSLLNKLGINVEGDNQDKEDGRSLQVTMKWASNIMAGIEKHEKKNPCDGEPLLSWRNRCGNRTSAMSVVGTSQYMAPEVWSIGVILYECLYGHTPFLAEEGRQVTKQNIIRHRETFGFPHRPVVSYRCQHLIASLIQEKENRLCSKRYHLKDLYSASNPASGMTGPGPHANTRSASQKHAGKAPRDYTGHYVFPYDAEDIKAHKWFRGVPWERLHQLDPPWVPDLQAVDDTHWFEEGEQISDWSESETSESELLEAKESPEMMQRQMATLRAQQVDGALTEAAVAATVRSFSLVKVEAARLALRGLRRSVQKWALAAIATPYDSTRLRDLDAQIEGLPGLAVVERNMLRQFIREFGHKNRKRPRDRLLRDRNTRAVVMDVRKKTAFLGYTWRRIRPPARRGSLAGAGMQYNQCVPMDIDQDRIFDVGLDDGGVRRRVAHGGWGDGVPASMAMYRGRMSLR
ncbi:serine/threonine-protein kinase [Podospora aff. communis PSN243]|uniref:non-specific serine/threonine protein kinase n=1 Tax=Podospora aff. communis PSN243 TaxID=3040156 RepID=A0AAV9GMT5_9PEZI|nr:serine/threonine-protein kinase [Podospora aff. communis PSN243]